MLIIFHMILICSIIFIDQTSLCRYTSIGCMYEKFIFHFYFIIDLLKICHINEFNMKLKNATFVRQVTISSSSFFLLNGIESNMVPPISQCKIIELIINEDSLSVSYKVANM